MYGLVCGLWFVVVVKTDNTAYQALVLVWLGCGKKNLRELGHTKLVKKVSWSRGV